MKIAFYCIVEQCAMLYYTSWVKFTPYVLLNSRRNTSLPVLHCSRQRKEGREETKPNSSCLSRSWRGQTQRSGLESQWTEGYLRTAKWAGPTASTWTTADGQAEGFLTKLCCRYRLCVALQTALATEHGIFWKLTGTDADSTCFIWTPQHTSLCIKYKKALKQSDWTTNKTYFI